MPVVVTKEIKRRRMFLAIFVVLVLASAVILYRGIFSSGAPPSVLAPPVKPAAGEKQISDLNVKILEDERFRNLLPPPGVPLKTETTGKSNPFSD